jgi:hypothetical protein
MQETSGDASPSLLTCGQRPLETLTSFALIRDTYRCHYGDNDDNDLETVPEASTPLHEASENGHFETCRLLISLKADVNARDKE